MPDWKFIFEKWVLRQHRRLAYEPQVKAALLRLHGHLFVDVGANRGIYCQLLSKNFDKIIAFEPNPDMIVYLPNYVDARNIALWDEDGEADFYLSGLQGGGADTLLKEFDYAPNPQSNTQTRQVFHGRNPIRVLRRRYDSAIAEPADLVKIDVEGAEREVLRGMKGAFEKGAVKNVMVEVHNIAWTADIVGLLQDYGFTVETLDSHPRLLAHLSAPTSQA